VSYQQRLFFDHLKLHDKYLFDGWRAKLLPRFASRKWGILLVIHCLTKIFVAQPGIMERSALIAHRSRDSVSQLLRERAR
jgi:hypothetical protein